MQHRSKTEIEQKMNRSRAVAKRKEDIRRLKQRKNIKKDRSMTEARQQQSCSRAVKLWRQSRNRPEADQYLGRSQSRVEAGHKRARSCVEAENGRTQEKCKLCRNTTKVNRNSATVVQMFRAEKN